jgi:hypothetical protein
MVDSEKIIKYQCGNCGYEYDSMSEAEDCCPNNADEIEAWKCGNCGKEHDDEDEAEECCNKEVL